MAKGDLTVVDSQTYETSASLGHYTSVVPGINDIYLAFSTGSGSDGYVYSVTIDSAGNISAPIDSLEFQASSSYTQFISAAQVSEGRVMAVCQWRYTDVYTFYDGLAVTVSVDASGNLAIEHTHVFGLHTGPAQEGGCYSPDIVEVATGVFAVVARWDAGNDGWVWTLEVDGSGNISTIDSEEFSLGDAQYPHIVHLVDDIYVIATDAATLSTVEITSAGAISTVDSASIDYQSEGAGGTPDLVKVSDTVVAVVSHVGARGCVVTHSVDAAGTINNSSSDIYVFTDGETPDTATKYHIVDSGIDNVFVVTYINSDTGNPMQLMSLTISDAGAITTPYLDRITITGSTNNRRPFQLNISDGLCAISYQSSSSVCALYTYSVDAGPASRTPVTGIYVPVIPVPYLKSGDNDTGYAVGHDPKYSIDGNPDTWWTASDLTDHTISYDLGEAVYIDAVVMWLHNYNEGYGHGKSWVLSYSTDGTSYTALSEKEFYDYREVNSPIVVDELTLAISARYWKITFTNFDGTPIESTAQLSAIWFCNGYNLPYKHQRPENNTFLWYTTETQSRAGSRFATSFSDGKQRLSKRKFFFVKSDSQYDTLIDAFKAARGGLLPIFMKSEWDTEYYHGFLFDKPFAANQIDYETYNPETSLLELGFTRAPFNVYGLLATTNTVAHWKFNQNGLDSTSNDNDLTMSGGVTSAFYDYGVCQTGLTSVKFDGTEGASITKVSGWDFDMGDSDFTIETFLYVATSPSPSEGILMSTGFVAEGPSLEPSPTVSPTGGGEGILISVASSGVVQVELEDISGNDVVATGAVDIVDGEWHHVAVVVDRTGDTVKIYIDGIQDSSTSIASITGDIDSVGDLVIANVTNYELAVTIDEMMVTKEAFTSTAISGRSDNTAPDYGTWGM